MNDDWRWSLTRRRSASLTFRFENKCLCSSCDSRTDWLQSDWLFLELSNLEIRILSIRILRESAVRNWLETRKLEYWRSRCCYSRTQRQIITKFSRLACNWHKLADNVSWWRWLFRFDRRFSNDIRWTTWHQSLIFCTLVFKSRR
jgi:hypothetical protein